MTAVTRDSMGCVTEVDTPASVTGYTHSTGAITVSTSAGLINTFVRVSSGCDKGFVSDKKWKQGTSGTAYLDGSWTYDTATAQLEVTGSSPADTTIVRPFLSSKREYTTAVTSGTSGSNLWNYSTSVYSGKLAIEKVETTQPAVSTGNNGSNSAVVTSKYFNTDGTLAFEKSGTGRIDYTAWSGGQVSKKIQDADTTKTAGGQDFNGVSIPSGFSSSGTPFHMKTTYAYDAQGRSDTTTVPSGRIEKNYFSRLADHRQVSMHLPKVSGSTKYSPASYSVTNHAGKSEFSGTVGFTSGNTTAAYTALIDETDTDPITALDTGTVTRMSTSVMDESGTRIEESRGYFLVPASGAGADGTNYDPTFFKYDDSGRVIRTLDPTGTITAMVFDAIGRKLESWIGKNDADIAGADDMVKISDVVYDSGSDGGNSLVTKSTQYIQDSGTGKRETAYSYDVRGNALLVTNPLAPHQFNKFDNLNRRIASGSFSSTGSITLGSDDPTTETTNRLSLSQTFYDERGQVWKSQGHKIDESDGSDDDNLQTLTWYDADGRQVKQDGAQLTKTAYDSLGRAVDSFVLATDNDASYSDVSTVTGDVVVEQQVRGYNPTSGLLELETTISRFHDDVGGGQTTGALDTNADNDRRNDQATQTKGRANIVGTWYDANLDRPTNKVAFGTNNGSDYDRGSAGSAPGSTDVILGNSTTYNTDGTVDTVTDPKGRVTKYTYDAMGRKTKEIRNYNSGVNSGNPYGTDDNVTTAWEYTDGNMTKLKAMLPGGGSQDTTYAYGVTKGASAGDSKISSGHLLHTVTYPDGGGDVVTYAYNAQGQMTYKLDQAGNVHDYTMDDLGRQTKDVWSTNISGFDTAVRRVESTYQSDGKPQLVTQYDATSAGNVVDEVKYLYDSWGNISDFQYDRDSAVGASPDNKYAVSYAYAKSTTGRNSVRKTSMTMPSGQTINYEYSSSSSLDDAMSRVTDLKQGAQILAQYEYNGAGMVVGTTYPEPGVSSKLHRSTSGVYDALDRFNRVIKSRWTKDSISKEFYDVAITWDRTDNPTVVDDKVQTGFDVQYTLDDLDRVTRAEEGTWDDVHLTLGSRTRDQQWTLSHTGNWDREKLDLNGDGDFVDTNEHDDTRTHDAVNQLNARDTDSNASNNYSLTYDADGNLTDDAENYKYVYDGWGRLRFIKKTSNSAVVAEYKYNGLGFRTAQHEDTDADLDVDSSDKWYYLMYDERWRHLSTFRETDSGPKEEFVPHEAGLDGEGDSSYIDLLVCRERDESSGWTSASDGSCETRIYYCQNWRADVSVIVSSAGAMIEWMKYSAYGKPFGLPKGDTDSDGDCDAVDVVAIAGSPAYDVRCDVNLDGLINASDVALATAASLGAVSASSVGNVASLSGHELLGKTLLLLDCRNRVINTTVGKWSSRDPIGYSDSTSLNCYVDCRPIALVDPYGLSKKYVKIKQKNDKTIQSEDDKKAAAAAVEEYAKDFQKKIDDCCKLDDSGMSEQAKDECKRCCDIVVYTVSTSTSGEKSGGGTPGPNKGHGPGAYYDTSSDNSAGGALHEESEIVVLVTNANINPTPADKDPPDNEDHGVSYMPGGPGKPGTILINKKKAKKDILSHEGWHGLTGKPDVPTPGSIANHIYAGGNITPDYCVGICEVIRGLARSSKSKK